MNLSTAAKRRRVFGAAARMNDGGQVVGAQMAFDEAMGRCFHKSRPQRVRLEIVQHDEVEAAQKRLGIGHDVGLDRPLGEERSIGPLDRYVDRRVDRHLLRLAILEDLKIVLVQIANEIPLFVGHDGVDLDVVDLDFERHGRLLSRRRRRWLLPRRTRREHRGDHKK